MSDTRTYNTFGELSTYRATVGGIERFKLEYTQRDALGRITEKREIVNGVTTTFGYEYDSAGRLASVTTDGVETASYTYDANGNRLTAPGLTTAPVYDDQDRLLTYGAATYTGVEVTIEIAGKTFFAEYPPADNLVHVFDDWDGTDRYGRLVQGSRSYEVTIAYVYQAVPLNSSGGSGGGGFGSAGTSNIIGDRARFEIRLFQKHRGRLSYWRIRSLRELGGWNLDVHHAYDVPGQVLLLGTGERRSAGTMELSPIIQTIAGTGTAGNIGDNGPALDARVSPNDITTAPDGSIYFVNGTDRIRRIVAETGDIELVAGGGTITALNPPPLATEVELALM